MIRAISIHEYRRIITIALYLIITYTHVDDKKYDKKIFILKNLPNSQTRFSSIGSFKNISQE